jgi:hypothetical protein
VSSPLFFKEVFVERGKGSFLDQLFKKNTNFLHLIVQALDLATQVVDFGV